MKYSYIAVLLFLLPIGVFAQIPDLSVNETHEIICPVGGDSIFIWEESGQGGPDNFEGRCPSAPSSQSGVYDSASWVSSPDGYTITINLAGDYYYDIYDVTGVIVLETGMFLVSDQAQAGFQSIISDAETGFSSTTGMTQGAVVSWTATEMTKPFIGGALSLLYFLRYWIVAVIIIWLIVFFIFRKKRT